MHPTYVILYLSLYVIMTIGTENPLHQKGNTTVDDARKELHVRVLKYLSGRYQSIRAMQNLNEIEDSSEGDSTTTIEGSTTMAALIQAPSPTPPTDELNMNVFGGYFSSLLGNSLAHHFNVTTKIQTIPPFVMVHYFFRGDLPSPHGALLGEANLVQCQDVVAFCPEGSKQVCARNNTVYCVTPMAKTAVSVVEGLRRPCLATRVLVRCWKQNVDPCEKVIPLHIPCYATINMVEGDEHAVNKVYKGEYCVIIMGLPVPKYTNREFMDFVRKDEDEQRILNHQMNSLTDVILKQMFL